MAIMGPQPGMRQNQSLGNVTNQVQAYGQQGLADREEQSKSMLTGLQAEAARKNVSLKYLMKDPNVANAVQNATYGISGGNKELGAQMYQTLGSLTPDPTQLGNEKYYDLVTETLSDRQLLDEKITTQLSEEIIKYRQTSGKALTSAIVAELKDRITVDYLWTPLFDAIGIKKIAGEGAGTQWGDDAHKIMDAVAGHYLKENDPKTGKPYTWAGAKDAGLQEKMVQAMKGNPEEALELGYQYTAEEKELALSAFGEGRNRLDGGRVAPDDVASLLARSKDNVNFTAEESRTLADWEKRNPNLTAANQDALNEYQQSNNNRQLQPWEIRSGKAITQALETRGALDAQATLVEAYKKSGKGDGILANASDAELAAFRQWAQDEKELEDFEVWNQSSGVNFQGFKNFIEKVQDVSMSVFNKIKAIQAELGENVPATQGSIWVEGKGNQAPKTGSGTTAPQQAVSFGGGTVTEAYKEIVSREVTTTKEGYLTGLKKLGQEALKQGGVEAQKMVFADQAIRQAETDIEYKQALTAQAWTALDAAKNSVPGMDEVNTKILTQVVETHNNLLEKQDFEAINKLSGDKLRDHNDFMLEYQAKLKERGFDMELIPISDTRFGGRMSSKNTAWTYGPIIGYNLNNAPQDFSAADGKTYYDQKLGG